MKRQNLEVLPSKQVGFVVVLAVISGGWCVLSNNDNQDMINTLIASHFAVLVSQTIVLLFFSWQVLKYRAIYPLIAIRKKTELLHYAFIKRLLIESCLYFGGYSLPFLFTDAPRFLDGPMLTGSLLLFLRFLFIALMAILLVGMLHCKHPGMLLMTVFISNIIYHYVIEINYLLIMYSPIYDPLYRAIHGIYY